MYGIYYIYSKWLSYGNISYGENSDIIRGIYGIIRGILVSYGNIVISYGEYILVPYGEYSGIIRNIVVIILDLRRVRL